MRIYQQAVLVYAARRLTIAVLVITLAVLVGSGSAQAAGVPPYFGGWSYTISQTTWTVSALINPNGAQTTYYLEYGPDTHYGSATPEQTMAQVDSTSHKVTIEVSGLPAGSEYHGQVVASNAYGTSTSGDLAVLTPAGSGGNNSSTGSTGNSCGAIASTNFYVSPTGGVLDPLGADGSITYVPNGGYVRVVSSTGQNLYGKNLSWGGASCHDDLNDSWSFDARKLSPDVYQYCGAINGGSGYNGSQECRAYTTSIERLFIFGRGHNTRHGLRVPLRARGGIIGQRAVVTATWYRAKHHRARGWQKSITWKRIKVRRYQLTMRPHQLVSAGPKLRRERKVIISLSFPGISGNTDPNRDREHWQQPSDCALSLHGAIRKPGRRKRFTKPDFYGHRYIGRSVACTGPVVK